MSFITFHSKKSYLSENCLWIKDGSRYICVSYIYFTSNGYIQYAASVLKSDSPTDEQIKGHEHTTIRRFQIRPNKTYIGSFMNYDDMLKKIRREMCHGLGCVGPRHPISRICNPEPNDFILGNNYEQFISKYYVSPKTYMEKTVNYLKFGYVNKESHNPNTSFTQRTIFICFKGIAVTGDVLYGACIHHVGVQSIEEYNEPEIDDDAHYETAMMRLEKFPVQMNIPYEFRHQLKKDTKHNEDVMYKIVDKIKVRIDGHFQIKGTL